MPLFILLIDGEPVVPPDTLKWAFSVISVTATPRAKQMLRVLWRLYVFWLVHERPILASGNDLETLICAYLFTRINSPDNAVDRVFPDWERISSATATDELSILSDYARFCRKNTLPSVFGLALDGCGGLFEANKAKRQESVFSHLDLHWERWKQTVDGSVGLPVQLAKYAKRRPKASRKIDGVLTIAEVEAIIENAPSAMIQALLILLAFGGIRCGMALNLWCCDILDGSYCRDFYRFNSPFPLVVLSHPRTSTYIGDLPLPKTDSETRESFLLRKFDMNPRPDAEIGGAQAGDKEMEYSGPSLTAMVHWISDKWALRFAELIPEIMRVHRIAGTDAYHPFFFINASNSEFFGVPMKIKNLQQTFDRVLASAGILKGQPGANLHGLRHFYVWYYANELRLSESDGQMMLNHRRVTSQRDYGRDAKTLHEKIAKNMGARHAA